MTNPDPNSASLSDKEPAWLTALFTMAVSSTLDLLVHFGLTIPDATKTWIMAAVPILAILISALRIRGLVFSPATWAKAQRDLQVLAQSLTGANAIIDGHDDALRIVEATMVSALQTLLLQVPAAPAAPQPSPLPVPSVMPPQPVQTWSTSPNWPMVYADPVRRV